jgi:hypothetical protein
MVECTDLENKVVRRLKIFDEPGTDPEVVIEFTDGTVFSACLRLATAVEAKCYRDEGGEPLVLADYIPSAWPAASPDHRGATKQN